MRDRIRGVSAPTGPGDIVTISREGDALLFQPGERYDRLTVALHWAVAVLVALQWCSGQTIDWFPKGDARIAARSVHIILGSMLAALLGLRIVWRAFYGSRLPRSSRGFIGLVVGAMHYALYGMLIAIVALGIFSTALRGDSIFGLFHIPRLGAFTDAARHAFANQIVDWHGLAANITLGLAALHAGAGLIHHYFFSRKVLYRMSLR